MDEKLVELFMKWLKAFKACKPRLRKRTSSPRLWPSRMSNRKSPRRRPKACAGSP